MIHSAPFAHSDYQVIELKASYIDCDALEELSIGGGEKGRFPLCSRAVSVKCLIHLIVIGRSSLSSAYYHQEE